MECSGVKGCSGVQVLREYSGFQGVSRCKRSVQV